MEPDVTTTQTLVVPEDDLDRRVAAYEAAWNADEPVLLERFLAPRSSPIYPRLLAELIRIDLEFRWSRGERPRLESYRGRDPDLFADPSWVRDLAFEEFRLRRAMGEAVERSEYGSKYGVDVSGWPEPESAIVAAEPKPGEIVGSFRILSELGRGAFGRVYLAEQIDLAGRMVALKLSTRFGVAEPNALARLQHTNIVPIYSTERHGRTQAIVMPYLGSTTLADVLTALKTQSNWPQSGKALADTVVDRASRTRTSRSLPVAPAVRPASTLPLEQLRKLSYVDAVLWIGWKLADALAHAHERGILHRDIKPANVLLTDDGQPMLLDFNLAVDADALAEAGGTPAYMAPEQLASLKKGRAKPDPRTDVFSLGLVLAELLIGFTPRVDSAAVPRLRELNPRITPSTEAILQKCLAFAPENRYSSAAELRDDLNRQLTHQPLLATKEPSVRERFQKWKQRHPVFASTGAVAAVAIAFIVALGLSLVARQRYVKLMIEEREAVEKLADFHRDVPVILERVALRDTGADAGELRRLVARYAVTDNPAWTENRFVARLPETNRRELFEQLGELLLLQARLEPDREAAIQLNRRAAEIYGKFRPVPRSVWQDRYEFATSLGREAEARESLNRAKSTEPDSRDWYLSGLAVRKGGNLEEAEKLFERAVEENSQHYWSWLLLGDVRTGLSRDDLAESCFNACIALKPDDPAAHYNRGLCRHRLKRYAAAIADFTKTFERDEGRVVALIARGISHQSLGQWPEAEADFSRALDCGTTETRVYFLRSEVRTARRDAPGEKKDRSEGMKREPRDEVSWITRALAKAAAGDVPGALSDLDAALKLNPRSYAALMNKANLLDDKLHRESDAVLALDRLIECHPHVLIPRSGRAVLLARLGRKAAAKADAEYCRARNPEPFVRYQLAGAYARLAKSDPSEAATAFELLRSALKDGTGHQWLASDPDLEPLHGNKEFREILEAARVLAPSNVK